MQAGLILSLASRPELLILDEVTSVLDARARFVLLREVRALAESGACVILATNIVTEVHSLADRLLLIEGGRVSADLDLRNPSGEFVLVRVRVGSVFEAPRAWVPIEEDRLGGRLYVLRRRDLPPSLPPEFSLEGRAPRPEEIFILVSGGRS